MIDLSRRMNFFQTLCLLLFLNCSCSTFGSDRQEIAVRTTNEAIVWRPYLTNVTWSGGVDGNSFATGEGELRVYDKSGKIAAIFRGTMSSGRLSGEVQAAYPNSKDRAGYQGQFSDWSENGSGTLLLRNGQKIAGIWHNGEFVRGFDAPAAPVSRDAALRLDWRSPDVQERLKDLGATAATDLKSHYDLLKGQLPERARSVLIDSQRAWIGYNETMLLLAKQALTGTERVEAKVAQLDYGMTLMRDLEILFLIESIQGEQQRLSSASDLEVLGGRLRQRNDSLANIPALDQRLVETMRTKFIGSCDLAEVLSNYKVNSSTGSAQYAHLRSICLRHGIEALEFILPDSDQILPPTANQETTEEDRKLASKSVALIFEIEKLWPVPAQEALQWTALPSDVEARLTAILAELKLLNHDFDQKYKTPQLELAACLQQGLVAGKGDASKIFGHPKLAASIDTSAAWNRRLADLQQILLKKRERCLTLQKEAAALLSSSDSEAALKRIGEASSEFSTQRTALLGQVFSSYAALVQDHSLRAVDDNWKKPSLPASSVLTTALTISDAWESKGEANPKEPSYGLEIAPESASYASALRLAYLLQTFVADYVPSGNRDCAHPLRAFGRMSDKEMWKDRIKSDINPANKRIA